MTTGSLYESGGKGHTQAGERNRAHDDADDAGRGSKIREGEGSLFEPALYFAQAEPGFFSKIANRHKGQCCVKARLGYVVSEIADEKEENDNGNKKEPAFS